MTPEDEAQLAVLKSTHAAAEEHERQARERLYAFIQAKLKEGPRGTLTELIEKTGYSRQRLGDIKAGKWSRNPDRNPVDIA